MEPKSCLILGNSRLESFYEDEYLKIQIQDLSALRIGDSAEDFISLYENLNADKFDIVINSYLSQIEEKNNFK